jgi:hypothetical protein
MQKNFTLLFFLCYFPYLLLGQVYINEVCSDNETIILDDFGENSDWIELYNSSNVPINLSGYFLSDDPDNLQKWTFPNSSIEANGYRLIFASEEDVFSTYIHTNFKLSKNGEPLLFSNTSGTIIDQLIIPPLEEDISYGRSASNINEWFYYNAPTPGFENNGNTAFQFNSKPTFTTSQAFHQGSLTFAMTCDEPNCVIRYTTDGSPPTMTSPIYSAPITTDTTLSIRASTFSTDRLPSRPATKTYFVDVQHELPVIALTTDPFLLYDWETGIFVDGPDADSLWPYFGANFWKDITIPIHLEYFIDNELTVNYDLGTKIHGGQSSRSRKMKSIQLIADYQYGEKDQMDYPFFKDRENQSYKRLVLRNASGDFNYTHCRDGYMHRYLMAEELNLDLLAYQPVVAYLNGQYWGLINLREKVNEYYLENNHQAEMGEIDLLEEDSFVIEGSMEIFDEMLNQLENSDITDNSNLELAALNFDFDNIIDYVVTETALCNSDWPSNNVKYWRERKAGSKWRYILVDLDAIMGRAPYTRADGNFLIYFMNLERFDHVKLVRLVRTLLQNQTFRNQFLNRYADLLNTTFRSENLLLETANIQEELDAEIFLHFQKWTWPGYDVWLDNRLPTLYNFARNRPPYARQYLMEEFDLSNEVELQLNVFPPEAGFIKVNSIQPETLPWDGYYFNGVPITLTVIPNPGYTFKHWESVHTILNPNASSQITMNFETDDAITAFFNSEDTAFEVNVSPNPTTGEVNVHLLLSEINPIQIKLYDVMGKELQNNDYGRIGAGEQTLTVDLSGFPKGVYLLEAISGEEQSVEKIVLL